MNRDWHHHHFVYDEQERRKKQNPEEILIKAGLKKGMVFADIGSNDGFFTMAAVNIIGEQGKIIAIDINKESIERLAEKLKKSNFNNYTLQIGPAEEAKLDNDSIDFIFFGTVLHDFYDPNKVLKISKSAIKENGIIYDYDFQKKITVQGPPVEIRLDEQDIAQLASKADLSIVSVDLIDDSFYGITMKR